MQSKIQGVLPYVENYNFWNKFKIGLVWWHNSRKVIMMEKSLIAVYRNDAKFSDRYALANSTDPDQTAPTGSTLFTISSASFGHITLW